MTSLGQPFFYNRDIFVPVAYAAVILTIPQVAWKDLS